MGTKTPAKILVIDDEGVVRETVARVLTPDYEVRTLASSEHLDETLKPFHPDLIILDVRMPQEDGWQICGWIRRQRRYDLVPIVFLSGLNDETAVRKGFALGGDFFLPKPFNIDELLRVVNLFLRRNTKSELRPQAA